MQVLKNKKLNLVAGFLFLISGMLSAQSEIGVKIPPFKQAEFSYTFQIPNLQVEQSPFHFNNSYYNPYLKPAPFKSPLLNDVLTGEGYLHPVLIQNSLTRMQLSNTGTTKHWCCRRVSLQVNKICFSRLSNQF